MNLKILQTPGQVGQAVMLHEMFHELRVIPLDGRPPPGVAQWNGRGAGSGGRATPSSSRPSTPPTSPTRSGAPWRKARSSLRLVEPRFTRVGPASIDYTFTLEDPEAFERAWTTSAPMTTGHASRGVTAGEIWE